MATPHSPDPTDPSVPTPNHTPDHIATAHADAVVTPGDRPGLDRRDPSPGDWVPADETTPPRLVPPQAGRDADPFAVPVPPLPGGVPTHPHFQQYHAERDADRAMRAVARVAERWGAHYHVHADLLPFAYRGVDPIELLKRVRGYLDGLPRTRQRFALTDIADALSDECDLDTFVRADGVTGTQQFIRNLPEKAYLMHGAFPLPADASGNGKAYANPNYVHKRSLGYVTTPSDRTYWAQQCSCVGTLDASACTALFGVGASSVRSWFHDYNIPWDAWRWSGRIAMARTWATLRAWGYPASELATAFGVPAGTVYAWTQEHARDHGFVPPADPSNARVFTEARS